MEQFATTYRKDYLWPYVKTIGIKPEPENLHRSNDQDDKLCRCHQLPPLEKQHQRELLGPLATKEESWSRLGPMGPLLDPKLYPAKVSAAPESKASLYNQPNVFLKKLQEKYPFIYECLRTAPPDDLLARINRDRIRSTYQVDFCKMTEYPSAPYDELLRAAGVQGSSPALEPQRLPGDPYRPRQKSIFTGNKGNKSRNGSAPKKPCGDNKPVRISSPKADEMSKFCVGSCRGPLGSVTPGVSEYTDAVARLGYLIMKENLHHPQKNREGSRG